MNNSTSINKKLLKKFRPMTMALYPKRNSKNRHFVFHIKFIRPKNSFRYYFYHIKNSKNNKVVPKLSYVRLFRAYVELVSKYHRRCADLKKLMYRNDQLLKKIKSSCVKSEHDTIDNQHINYTKLNNRIDNFKKLVDRS